MLTFDQLPASTAPAYGDLLAQRDLSESIVSRWTKKMTIAQLIDMGPGGEAVPIEQYGGVGDGATDNTAAFVAAQLAAGVGGIVYLQPGKNYYVASTVFYQRDYLRIVGPGATISFLPTTSIALKSDGRTGCALIGVTLDGGASSGLAGSAGAIDIVNSTEFTVSGCELNNIKGIAIRVVGLCPRIVIEGNKFYRNFNSILIDDDAGSNNPTYCRVIANTFTSGWGLVTDNFSGAIKVSGIGTIANVSGHVIANNVITSPGNVGIEIQDFVNDCTVTGNVVYHAAFGISLSHVMRTAVTGNNTHECTFCGIEVASACVDTVVSGNTITNRAIGPAEAGISASSSSRMTLNGNSISGNGLIDKAIFFFASSDALVSGNHICGVAQCVYSQNSSGLNVTGNMFSDGGYATPFSCVFLDASAAAISKITIASNRLTTSVNFNTFIRLYTPNAFTITDVMVSGNDTTGATFTGNTWSIDDANKIIGLRSVNNLGGDGSNGQTSFTFTKNQQSSNVVYPYQYMYFANGCMFMDASGGARTAQLPPPAVVGYGFRMRFTKSDSSGNSFTILPNAAENINFGASYVLAAQSDTVTLFTDGANWYVESTG